MCVCWFSFTLLACVQHLGNDGNRFSYFFSGEIVNSRNDYYKIELYLDTGPIRFSFLVNDTFKLSFRVGNDASDECLNEGIADHHQVPGFFSVALARIRRAFFYSLTFLKLDTVEVCAPSNFVSSNFKRLWETNQPTQSDRAYLNHEIYMLHGMIYPRVSHRRVSCWLVTHTQRPPNPVLTSNIFCVDLISYRCTWAPG